MKIKFFKVTSNENGLVGISIEYGENKFFILKKQSFLEGIRYGTITPNLTETLNYELLFEMDTA